MAKKMFNFEDMENVPIARNANDVMVKAYEEPAPVADKVDDAPEDKDVSETIKEDIITEPKKKVAKKKPAEVAEEIRDEFNTFVEKYKNFDDTRNLQLELPIEMHIYFEELKNEWHLPRKGKLSKKDICFVALEEFLQKHGKH